MRSPPAPTTDEPTPVAPTRAGQRVVTVLEDIASSMIESKYQPSTSVRVKGGARG